MLLALLWRRISHFLGRYIDTIWILLRWRWLEPRICQWRIVPSTSQRISNTSFSMEKQRRHMPLWALINYYGRINMSFCLGSWIQQISKKKWGQLTWSFNSMIVTRSIIRRSRLIFRYLISEKLFNRKWRRKNQWRRILRKRGSSRRKRKRKKWRNRRRRRQRKKMLNLVSLFFHQRRKFYWTIMEYQHVHLCSSSSLQWEALGTKSQWSLATLSKTSNPKTSISTQQPATKCKKSSHPIITSIAILYL